MQFSFDDYDYPIEKVSSSYTQIRAVEADFLMSDEFQTWMKENNVELCNVNDIKEEFGF